MSVEHVEVLAEEPSMAAALEVLLPRIHRGITFEIHPFQCKTELLAYLPDRLRGYRHWLPGNWRILVVVDQDTDNCFDLKQSLEKMAQYAGFITKSGASRKPYTVVNRLAIEELEAWFFGDWEAVRAAYPRVIATIPQKRGYRNPDAIQGGTCEAFEKVLRKAGYFKGGLRKVEAARTIGRHMDPKRNLSRSFQVLCEAVREMAAL